MRFTRYPAAALLSLILLPGGSAIAADETTQNLTEAGDIVQLLLPLGAYVGTWIAGDKEGAYQFTKSLAASSITVHTIKAGVSRLRPDAGTEQSFPSGHTQSAFSGAEFIRIRYGNAWGIPAHIGALFVGYTRVRANKHFADDVLAGASIAMMWNWYFTSPLSETLELQPIKMDDGYGVEFNYNFDGRSRPQPDYSQSAKFYFNAEFGPVTQDKNLFVAPPEAGDVIDLATAENELDFTSRIMLRHVFRPRHEWDAYFSPMELVEFDPDQIVTEPVRFGGKTFVPTGNSQFRSRYNFFELRAVYRYALIQNDFWDIRVGGGAQYSDTFLLVEQFEGDFNTGTLVEEAEAESKKINAIASARIDYTLTERWRLDLELDANVGGDPYTNTALYLTWRASPEWTFGLGARYITWDLNDKEVKNELEIGDLIVRIGHSFF